MCGIVGIRSDLGSRDRLTAALDALAWRGPDAQRTMTVGAWHLGVARLAISDPGAQQPIRCAATGRVLVGNLATTSSSREWRQFGRNLPTRNDAELPLARLRAGAELLTATCGPYAFVIVDPKDGTLWLGRDPEGEKPLFVVVDRGEVLAFASTPSALAALGYPVTLGSAALAQHLRFGFSVGGQLTEGTARLVDDLRGSYVAPAGRDLQPISGSQPPPECAAADRAGARFRDRVTAAVRRCSATGAAPVGMFLSGGLDSACIAVALDRRPVPAYQFHALGTPLAERGRAKAVAERSGVRWRAVDGGPEVLDALPELTRAWGLPLGDPSILAAHATATAAARDGVRVMLSGEGADDLWLGYRRHAAAAKLDRHTGSWRWSAARLLRWQPRGWRSIVGGHSMRTLARAWRALSADDPYASLLEVVAPGVRRAMLSPEIGEGVLPVATSPSALDLFYGAPEGGPEDGPFARARFVDRAFYLRHDLLPKADIASLAAGVETRCPFLDPVLLNSPTTRTADRAELGKQSLRAAFAGDLPASVVRGPKIGFGLPLDAWLQESGLFLDLLNDRQTGQREHIQADGLRRVVDRHRRGGIRAGHALYLIGAVELWLRQTPGTR